MKPLISIVIPTYNRPQAMAACLQSMAALDYPREKFEVIVVDDGGQADLEPVMQPWRDEIHLTLLRQVNAGPGPARNTGVAKAQGTYIAFMDDDCTPAGDWLHMLETAFAQHPEHLVGGRVINRLTDNPWADASQLLVSYLCEYYNTDPEQARFFTGNNIALPRTEFLDVGGFDTNWPLAAGEDREFCDRWRHLGRPLAAAPDVIIHHWHPLTPGRFWRQHFAYGRGAYYFHRVVSERANEAVQIEPSSFYSNLVRYPFTVRASHPWGASARLILAQVANAAGFFRETAAPIQPPTPVQGATS